MTLRNRLARLERKHGGSDVPAVIFMCDETGEAHGALMMGGGALLREEGESAEAFAARAGAADAPGAR